MNKRITKSILEAKKACEFFATLNTAEEALKKNLKTTAKGLELALAIVKCCTENNIKL